MTKINPRIDMTTTIERVHIPLYDSATHDEDLNYWVDCNTNHINEYFTHYYEKPVTVEIDKTTSSTYTLIVKDGNKELERVEGSNLYGFATLLDPDEFSRMTFGCVKCCKTYSEEQYAIYCCGE